MKVVGVYTYLQQLGAMVRLARPLLCLSRLPVDPVFLQARYGNHLANTCNWIMNETRGLVRRIQLRTLPSRNRFDIKS
jgi:hypothetical protein